MEWTTVVVCGGVCGGAAGGRKGGLGEWLLWLMSLLMGQEISSYFSYYSSTSSSTWSWSPTSYSSSSPPSPSSSSPIGAGGHLSIVHVRQHLLADHPMRLRGPQQVRDFVLESANLGEEEGREGGIKVSQKVVYDRHGLASCTDTKRNTHHGQTPSVHHHRNRVVQHVKRWVRGSSATFSTTEAWLAWT